MTAIVPTLPAQKPNPTLWTWPNVLTGLRLALCLPLFGCIVLSWWWYASVLLLIAAASDWLDGWLARRTKSATALGRNLDPLADKVLVCGSLIFLMPYSNSGVAAWMVAIVVIRELLVTSLRSAIEHAGTPFGAALLGKLKMVLQALALLVVMLYLAIDPSWPASLAGIRQAFLWLRDGLLYATVAITAMSGLQYLWRAYAVLRQAGSA